MEETKSRGGGFLKGLKTALGMVVDPKIAVVARTQGRAEYIRSLCREVVPDADQRVFTYIEYGAADALREGDHQIIVLDASLDEPSRATLKQAAREKHASCKVLEIKKWSTEPPA